jgi:hypothetical protein
LLLNVPIYPKPALARKMLAASNDHSLRILADFSSLDKFLSLFLADIACLVHGHQREVGVIELCPEPHISLVRAGEYWQKTDVSRLNG